MAENKCKNITVLRECRRQVSYSSLEQFPRPWLDELATEMGRWLHSMDMPGRMGLFWASDLDSLAADGVFERSRRQAGGRFISPGAFRHTLANMDAAVLALALQITGPVMTFSLGRQMDVAESSAQRWLTAGRIAAAITVTESPVPSTAGIAGGNAMGSGDCRSSTDAGASIARQVCARYLTLAHQ